MKNKKQPETPKKRGRGQPRKEPTSVVRVPTAIIPEVLKLASEHRKKVEKKS